MSEEVKRYGCICEYHETEGYPYATMIDMGAMGMYVKGKDHDRLIAEKDARIAELKAMRDSAVGHWQSANECTVAQAKRIAALEAKLRELAEAITTHNDECEAMCGHGDQEGVACGYRNYFPRRCPDCPKRNWRITDVQGDRIDSDIRALLPEGEKG